MIRADGETQFRGDFQTVRDKFNIQREYRPPNSPEYNGCAVRGLSMLEVTSCATCIQAKNLLHGLKLPEDMERLCRIHKLGLSIHQCDSKVR